jgi:hypothetical protein
MDKILLIAINPPNEVAQNIREARKEIEKIVGRAIYGDHEPHITLFVNSFSSVEEVSKEIEVVANLRPQFGVSIAGIEVLEDPINMSQTAVYRVTSSEVLKELQKTVVESLNPLRTKQQENNLVRTTPVEKIETLRKYGYPYGPEDWIFHASIASFPIELGESVKDILKRYDKSINFFARGIELLEYEKDAGFRPLETYLFKKI